MNIQHDFLITKLYRPQLPTDCIKRSKLLHLLDEERRRPLTLVSAPAGYGKSVLVSNWFKESNWISVWLSLDKEDSDLKRFLRYLSKAVREQFPHALAKAENLSQMAEPPKPLTVANIISNELNAIEQPFFLALDDYHLINAGSTVNDVLRILLEHPPIPLHLVLITRRDPPLPLGRLRALGQVTDVRMQDLQFNPSETRDLLEQVVHIRASETAIANLQHELEGWVAGLRLLTLALRRAPDAESFMQNLHGGTQQMQAYLISEVVEGLPQPFRTWLLQSSVFDRFCASLCETVFDGINNAQADKMTGHEFIGQLEEDNLFLISLDDHEHWFRFHHLFRKLLQSELIRHIKAENIEALHMRASHWFEENGLIDEAIGYALKADNADTAADIMERHRLNELEKMNFDVVDRWLELLHPNGTDRPALELAEAFVAIRRFDIPRLVAIIKKAAPVIEEKGEYANLIGELRCLQGVLSYRMGDGETGLKLLQEARRRFQNMEKGGIAGTAAFHEALSLALCGRGEAALAQFEDLANMATTGSPIYHKLLISGLVIVSYFLGDLSRTSKEAVRLEGLSKNGGPAFAYGLSIYFQACADLHKGNFEAAAQRFDTHMQQRYAMPRQGVFSAMAGLALCRQLQQRNEAATRTVENLQNFALELNDANGLEIARSCRARIQLLQGDLDSAVTWAGFDSTPSGFAELYNAPEVPGITRARIWIVAGTAESLSRAYSLLQEIGKRTRNWHFTNQTIEAEALKSLALAGLGREDEALKCLSDTIALAAPGGWMRPFLEPGKPMTDLLGKLENYGLANDFSRQLLNEIKSRHEREASQALEVRETQLTTMDGPHDAPTPRELDVLELLAQRLQNKEISDRLFVSPETIKSHLKNIFQKLDVGKRGEAVEKAQKMGII